MFLIEKRKRCIVGISIKHIPLGSEMEFYIKLMIIESISLGSREAGEKFVVSRYTIRFVLIKLIIEILIKSFNIWKLNST